MKMDLNPHVGRYLEYSKMLIKDRFVYKINLLLMMAFQIMSPIVMLFVWTAIYLASGVSAINNFTLAQIITYFFIVSAMNAIAPNTAQAISDDIKYGNMFGILTRPLSYVGSVISYAAGHMFVDATVVGIPIIILVTVLMHISLSLYTWMLFVAAIILMLVLSIMAEFLIGCLSFFFIDIGGVATMFTFIMQFFSGGLIPLNLLPHGISQVVYALPFQFMLYTPAAIFTGALSSSQAIVSLEIGIVWSLVFLVLCTAMWHGVKRHIDSVGV